MADLISKTVRMPSDVVAYIEAQSGDTFSQKLLGVLEEFRFGDENRRKRIANYEEMLERQQKQLRTYSETAYNASRVTQQLGATLRDIDKLFNYLDDAAADTRQNGKP